ncbi:MAG TPA: hypothetical protein VNB06_05470 [Thermoanaerobaculia bacterium]|nr:hypothetical protein [Thermoanaerobaculia bacterium]
MAVLVVAVGLSGAFLINLCDLVYACGCRSWWNGAAEACNIANADPPHCPWCTAGWWGLGLPLGAIAAAQAAVLLWPGRASLLARTLLAAAAFPAIGTAVAVLWGMIVGYWR